MASQVSTIRRASEQGLEWAQLRAFGRQYELRAGDDIVGTLSWMRTCGTAASAVCEEGQWVFERPGIFSRKVQVREAGTGAEVGLFQPNWRGDGLLELVDGRIFQWVHANFWGTQWLFLGSAGEPLLRFQSRSRRFKMTASVGIASSGLPAKETSLLTMLGWYLMVLRSREMSAAAAASAAS